MTPEIWIENTQAKGKHIAGQYTHVYLLREDAEGNEERIEISSCVRGVDVRLHVGEVVTAKLDCFITGVSTRADVESLVLETLRPRRRGLWRRFRDVTTFGSVTREQIR